MVQTIKTLGVILAGGNATRMWPASGACNKHLMPVYDKPMIYYPLATLMLAGIREFVLISRTGQDRDEFKKLFEDCEKELGIVVHYSVQGEPRGIPDAFVLAQNVFDSSRCERVGLVLGDNLHYGATMTGLLRKAAHTQDKATIFSHVVKDPQRFGVVAIDENGIPAKIVEKPSVPPSNLAITGLYFYPPCVFDRIKNLNPSSRGELEITDLNNQYLYEQRLDLVTFPRGTCWFDTGTPDALLEASQFVQAVQRNQSVLVMSPHEVAYHNGWVTAEALQQVSKSHHSSSYGKYLQEILWKY